MSAERRQCPLCGWGFTPSHACESSCPMGEGCGMIKCPNCSYEFVERSRVADAVKALVERFKSFGRAT